MAPLSFVLNYGNLSAYMESYFQVYCAPDCVDGDSQWILNTYLAAGWPGIFLLWLILKKIRPKSAGIIIMFLTNLSLIASAWTLQVSIVGTAIMMGVVSGLGIDATLCIGFMYINGWASKNAGVLTGTLTSAPTILAVVQNQIITAYVNPKNLKADTVIGVRAYFSQREILERVPEIILILGFMGLGLQMFGYLLISNPPTASDHPPEAKDNEMNGYFEKGNDNICCDNPDSNSALVNKKESTEHYDAKAIKTDNFITLTTSKNGALQTNHQTNDGDSIKSSSSSPAYKVRSYTPSEALRSGHFYALWLYSVAVGYGIILNNNYYKQFGLLYINNDVFLTLVGSLIPVFASATRIILGTCIDRNILSIQDCLVISLAANSFLCAFWFFAPQVNDILYMVLVLALACAQSMFHTIVGFGVGKLFGHEHFYINYGLVYTSAFFTAIASAVAVTSLLQALGWFWLFTSSSVLSILVLFYVSSYSLCFKN
ncbi:hypothetical protein RRG08_062514 [Elysia crispata]|uniref:Uncharacterized protein n=1 Tax=Elysia crispata TaxID=231223 RepID=A0AAE1DJJ3_9GAST|nr:hypothetical protein RRG08_062514 [Elysia crispata]